MKFIGTIKAFLLIGSIHAIETSVFEDELDAIERSFLAVDSSERSLQASACRTFYYSTKIEITSPDGLSCSPSQLSTLSSAIDILYDEVVIADTLLSGVTLSTTFCPVKPRRQLRFEGGMKHDSDHEHRNLFFSTRTWKGAGKVSGGGTCTMCSDDDKDRRWMQEEEELARLGRQIVRRLRVGYSTINFNRDSDGKILPDGTYVSKEWYTKYGLTINVVDARGGYAPNGMARLFNSSNPIIDTDLGTPNNKCPGGGPGVGSGGEPGQRGENCIAQGNLLIVQESNKQVADDNINGGVLSFTFASATRVGHISMIDVEISSSIELVTPEGKTWRHNITNFGDNGAQFIPIDLVVKKMTIYLSSTGGISEIGVFRPTHAAHALSPEARSYMAKKSAFTELIPFLEFDLSYYLTTRINEMYNRNSTSCLYGKRAVIDVQIKEETKPTTC